MAAARVRPSVAILGCGAVGGAIAFELARAWKRARVRGELCLWSRRPESVQSVCKDLAGLPVRVRRLGAPEEALEGTATVLLCVPDDVVVALARRLARSVPPRKRAPLAVLHTNGLLGADVLGALQERGVAVGKLHPLRALSNNSTLLRDVSFGIAGDPRAVRAARSIVRWCGGRTVLLSAGSTPEYHAAASLLSGGLVALYELVDRLFARAVPSLDARRRALALDELASSTLANIWFDGTRTALTGAIGRGAESTVRRHLRALRSSPDALAAYQVLGRTMLELARARGSIDAGAHRRLARLIRAPGPKR